MDGTRFEDFETFDPPLKCAYLNLAKLFEMKEQQSTQNMLTIEPGYCNYLKQAADEKRSASHISVHQIEYVHSTLSTFRM
ncbi:hypothetical protein X801_01586 [Opisthorchis viverrini]|uniref:Uncharacterized protein n=1 Tax=Opisthorchis viverrini TaxID=6198 RepID=A0A1S8X781_OPIVI|nr:hypothetical protein X801_01586 [Opisthorchis viverrini]